MKRKSKKLTQWICSGLCLGMVLMLTPLPAMAENNNVLNDQNSDGYHDGDVAVFQAIIKAHPESADLSKIDKNDPGKWGKYVEWDSSNNPKRITKLKLNNVKLEGTLTVSGLDALTKIFCSDNKLQKLEGVSECTELNEVNCYNNSISELNLTGLQNLSWLNCGNNPLNNLDVSELTNLEELRCTNSALKELDASKLNKLKRLDCSDSKLLHDLKVTSPALIELKCSRCDISTLDVSDCTQPSLSLTMDKNPLEYLKIGKNRSITADKIGEGTIEVEPPSSAIKPNDFKATLKLRAVPDTGKGYCFDSWQSSDVAPTNKVVITLNLTAGMNVRVTANFIQDIPNDANRNGYHDDDETTIKAFINSLNLQGEFDLDDPADWAQKGLVTWGTASPKRVITLNVKNRDLTTLNLPDLPMLEELDVSGNKLMQLNGLSQYPLLLKLYCSNNNFSTLDVSGCDKLGNLSCVPNHFLTEVKTKGWTLVLDAGAGGRISLETFNINGNIKLKAVPENDYSFKGWTGLPVDASFQGSRKEWALFDTHGIDITASAVFEAIDPNDKDQDGFHDGDVRAINDMITDLDLQFPLGEPAKWEKGHFVKWSSTNPKRVEEVHLAARKIKGNLNASPLEELKTLECQDNQLTGLDISGCDKLQVLHCSENPFYSFKAKNGTLSISTKLTRGSVWLTSFDIASQEAVLEARPILSKGYTFENWTAVPGGMHTENPLTVTLTGDIAVTASFLPPLGDKNDDGYQDADVDGFKALCASHPSLLTGIDPNDPKTWGKDLLVTWDNSVPKKITGLQISGRDLKGSLDLSNLTNLEVLSCYNNELTGLDLSNCINLRYLSCSFNKLGSLNVSNLLKLQQIHCNNSELESLTLGNLPQLQTLECDNNALAQLDVSGLGNLFILSCSNNWLNALDVTPLTTLASLFCTDNLLETLDTAALKELGVLHCSNNKLKKLDLSSNRKMRELICDNNEIPALDLSGMNDLYSLKCKNNPFVFFRNKGGVTLEVATTEGGKVYMTDYELNTGNTELTARPNNGYTFQNWTLPGHMSSRSMRAPSGQSGSVDRYSPVIKFQLNQNTKVEADFKKNGAAHNDKAIGGVDKSDSANTSDPANIKLWMLTMLSALSVCLGLTVYSRLCSAKRRSTANHKRGTD